MNNKTIAVLGLGAMGSRIAASLLKTNYAVVVWNRSVESTKPLEKLGATVATSPRQAAERADVILSVVTDNAASESVWLTPETGAILGLTERKIAVEVSTLSIEWAQQLSRTIQSTGASFVAAPVVGSRPQAEAQALICLVGSDSEIDSETLEPVHPILSAFSGVTNHVGSVSQAMAMKLAVNAFFGMQVAAIAELLQALSEQGLGPDQSMACLSELPVMSPAAKGMGLLIAARQFAPMFPISLVEKDFGYACKMSDNMPTSAAVQQLYAAAIEQGYGNENITAIARLFS